MSKETLGYALLFIVMLLLQVLICNHIALFNVAVPLIFIYFIVRLPMNLGRGWIFTLSFLIGFCVDIFSDTPGVNALACTLLGALKRPALYAYVPRDDKTKIVIPTIQTLGVGVYSKYLLTMSALYCVLMFSIEFFNFTDIRDIAVMAASSTLLSFLIMLAIDCLIAGKKKF